jgi:hypothetical protein
MWASMGSGSPTLVALIFSVHVASFLGWLHLLPAAFLDRCSGFLASLRILRSLLQLRFHLHSFMHHPLRGCLQGLSPCHTLSGLPGFPLKSGWKPQWLHNSCILQVWKDSIMWITRSAASFSSRKVPFNCGCSIFWVPGQLSMVKQIQGNNLLWSPVQALMNLLFYTFEPRMGGAWPVPETPQSIFLIVLMQRAWLLFNN